MHLFLETDKEFAPEQVQRRLVYMLYERNDVSFHRGTFRVRGDVIDIFPFMRKKEPCDWNSLVTP